MIGGVNLLPYRAQARLRRRRSLVWGLVLVVLLALAVNAVWAWRAQLRLDARATRMAWLRAEIGQLQRQIDVVVTLQAQLDALQRRQAIVGQLRVEAERPLHLLDELARLLPDGVALTQLQLGQAGVVLNGQAQSVQRVSELLRRLEQEGVWLHQPRLSRLVAENLRLPGSAAAAAAGGDARPTRPIVGLVLHVQLREAAPEPASESAGAAAPAGPAGPSGKGVDR